MFQKLLTFTKKVADLADKPSGTATEIKAQFDAAPDEVRTYLNSLIDALKSTATGDSGAKNLGATAITGLTGADVQTLLEYLAAHKVSKDGGDAVNGDLTIGGNLHVGGAGHDIIFDASRTKTTNVYWNANATSDYGLQFDIDGKPCVRFYSDGSIGGQDPSSFKINALKDISISTGGDGWAYVSAPNGKVYLRQNDGTGVYVTNIAQSAFMPINASAFNINSDREMKKNIVPFEGSAENLINSTTVYQYNYKNELDGEMKHTGLIMQESPVEVSSVNGVGIDVYAMSGIMWKAIQELSAKNATLEARVTALENK